MEERMEWVGRGGRTAPVDLSRTTALELYKVAVERAAKEGLAMSTETVELTPSASLARAIDFALTKADPGVE